MLLYHRPVPAKAPKRRSRAGCVRCKEKKKKCNEARPQCDRCIERGLQCEYEPVKPRKRRRTSTLDGQQSGSPLTGTRPDVFQPETSEMSTVIMSPRSSNTPGEYDDSPHSILQSPVLPYEQSDAAWGPPVDAPLWPNVAIKEEQFQPFESSEESAIDDSLEEVYREEFSGEVLHRGSNAYSDLAMISPQTNVSPFDINIRLFEEFAVKDDRRRLMSHFCGVLSHLIVFKEEAGNPFQQLFLPIASRSLPLLNAIYAISSAHLEHKGVLLRETALQLHSHALQSLANTIATSEKTDYDEIMASIILLIYYEVVQGGSFEVLNSHLRGAVSVLQSRKRNEGQLSSFLENAFRYFDVICALSFGTAPLCDSSVAEPHPQPLRLKAYSPLSAVDALLGLVSDLWPIIHRIAGLQEQRRTIESTRSVDKAKAEGLQKELNSASSALEAALQQWTPTVPVALASTDSLAEDSQLRSILSNAEAYKQAAFVHLYRGVNHLPRISPQVQTHVGLGLQACLKVILFGGPMSALLWPLSMTACEAVAEEDRDTATTVFQHLEDRQGMQSVVLAWEVCREVWRQGDAGIETNWRSVCQQRGVELVFG